MNRHEHRFGTGLNREVCAMNRQHCERDRCFADRLRARKIEQVPTQLSSGRNDQSLVDDDGID